jgi:hypothetical protein
MRLESDSCNRRLARSPMFSELRDCEVLRPQDRLSSHELLTSKHSFSYCFHRLTESVLVARPIARYHTVEHWTDGSALTERDFYFRSNLGTTEVLELKHFPGSRWNKHPSETTTAVKCL